LFFPTAAMENPKRRVLQIDDEDEGDVFEVPRKRSKRDHTSFSTILHKEATVEPTAEEKAAMKKRLKSVATEKEEEKEEQKKDLTLNIVKLIKTAFPAKSAAVVGESRHKPGTHLFVGQYDVNKTWVTTLTLPFKSVQVVRKTDEPVDAAYVYVKDLIGTLQLVMQNHTSLDVCVTLVLDGKKSKLEFQIATSEVAMEWALDAQDTYRDDEIPQVPFATGPSAYLQSAHNNKTSAAEYLLKGVDTSDNQAEKFDIYTVSIDREHGLAVKLSLCQNDMMKGITLRPKVPSKSLVYMTEDAKEEPLTDEAAAFITVGASHLKLALRASMLCDLGTNNVLWTIVSESVLVVRSENIEMCLATKDLPQQ